MRTGTRATHARNPNPPPRQPVLLSNTNSGIARNASGAGVRKTKRPIVVFYRRSSGKEVVIRSRHLPPERTPLFFILPTPTWATVATKRRKIACLPSRWRRTTKPRSPARSRASSSPLRHHRLLRPMRTTLVGHQERRAMPTTNWTVLAPLLRLHRCGSSRGGEVFCDRSLDCSAWLPWRLSP
jgi:hypothetical protein